MNILLQVSKARWLAIISGLPYPRKAKFPSMLLICFGRRADSYGPAILSNTAARCTPCYRRNTSRGAALLEEEAVRLRNCIGPADLKQGRVLVGLRGAVLIRCHYAQWDRCYRVRVHNASFRGTATPKKKKQVVTNESWLETLEWLQLNLGLTVMMLGSSQEYIVAYIMWEIYRQTDKQC